MINLSTDVALVITLVLHILTALHFTKGKIMSDPLVLMGLKPANTPAPVEDVVKAVEANPEAAETVVEAVNTVAEAATTPALDASVLEGLRAFKKILDSL
jgi:hypothetical protein